MARYSQAILVSCEIPWDEDENLMEDVFRKEVQITLQRGFKHLYIFGTAGEGHAVDTARFQRIVEIFREETQGKSVHPMVGVIGLSTANIVERLWFAYDMGFRTFQISLPSWGVLNDIELMVFFKDVCNTFPDADFLHYNLPRSRRILNGQHYRRLIDAVPNLVATKTTSGGFEGASDLMKHSSELQHFFGERNFPHGAMYGECSLLASWAPASPHKTRELFDAGRRQELDRLFTLQADFHKMTTDVLGPVRVGEHIDGAYDKMLVRLGGLEEMPLRLLSPYQGFTEEQYQQCKAVLYEQYPDWVAQDLGV
ncbi:MAG: dihydrodipicolinate synthase family protein [Dehalococcoidia bacterium]|nr:dihydrodipicolinate synthase family protein [Dehalococcoidia bacterium]